MDQDDRCYFVKTALIIAIIVSVWGFYHGIHTVFAESITDTIKDTITGGLNDTVDKFTDQIDISSGNPLNTSKQETDDLMKSGSKMLSLMFDLLFATHDVAEDSVNFLSPVPIHPYILTGIAIFIAGLLAFSIIKRIAIHFIFFIVIALIVVAVIIFFSS